MHKRSFLHTLLALAAATGFAPALAFLFLILLL